MWLEKPSRDCKCLKLLLTTSDILMFDTSRNLFRHCNIGNQSHTKLCEVV